MPDACRGSEAGAPIGDDPMACDRVLQPLDARHAKLRFPLDRRRGLLGDGSGGISESQTNIKHINLPSP